MKSVKQVVMLLVTAVFLFASCDKDENKNNDEVQLGSKNGILLVTFGSSFSAPQETFKTIDAVAKAEFPNTEIRWGYTSDIILNKLRQGNGEGSLKGIVIDNDTPEEALEKMVKDGFSKISIQSLHIIPGDEFDDLLATVAKVQKLYPGLECTVGKPLLDSDADLTEVAEILVVKFKSQLDAKEPVLFMGHGTPHHVNHKKYADLELELQKLAPEFFIGTVEKAPMIDEVLLSLEPLANVNKVTITPLMSIAGDHANNDMNGTTGTDIVEDQSWKERLENEGYKVNSVMVGLGDYEEINAIWIEHLKAIKIQ